MAFIHHTASGNTYTAAEAPAVVRGIYAYHTRSLGWSDIGYNFLIDRFGTIYEALRRHEEGRRERRGARFQKGAPASVIGNFAAMRRGRCSWIRSGASPGSSRSTTSTAGTARRRCAPRRKFARGAQGATFLVVAGDRDANNTECPGNVVYLCWRRSGGGVGTAAGADHRAVQGDALHASAETATAYSTQTMLSLSLTKKARWSVTLRDAAASGWRR